MVKGTRLIVRRLFPNCILTDIITGDFAGEEVFIPRISLQPTNFPIEFKRLQFHVRVCYTLTSNKAQGMFCFIKYHTYFKGFSPIEDSLTLVQFDLRLLLLEQSITK